MPETATLAEVEPVPAVPRRRRLVGTVVWLAVAPFAVWAVVRLFGLERGYPAVQLIAFTPYVAAVAWIPALAAGLTRRWRAVAVAGVAVLVLGSSVLPRSFADPDEGTGTPLRVMAANLLAGKADAEFLVDLVRTERVDVLALQEYTPDAEDGLAAAGLGQLLPYRISFPLTGVVGSAVYSRFPVRDGGLRLNPGGFGQARATVVVPGAASVTVESIHPSAPWNAETTSLWKQGLLRQQPATVDGPIRVLAGDFNSTLDHAALRGLLDTGYRDAASVAGAGLTPTWPYEPGDRWIPGVTLDHVFADRRIGVRAFHATTVPGSDHRAILADLLLPPLP